MKKITKRLAIAAILAAGLWVGGSNASTYTYTSSGSTDASGTMLNQWYVQVPKYGTTINSHASLSGSSCGGGVAMQDCYNGNPTILQYSLAANTSASATVYNAQPSIYLLTHGVNGAPYSATYYFQTSVSWDGV